MFGKTLLKLFFTIVFLATSLSYGQSLSAVDAKVKTYPTIRFNTVEQLAEMIDQDFDTNLEKVRAIYSWITNNVAYSYDARSTMSISYRSEKERIEKLRQYQERTATITLKTKKAVCHGYSMLFKELCDQLGIPCKIVRGFGKSFLSDIASEFESNHAWNIVTIDDEDYLVDSTWGAGYMNGNRFVREVTDVYFLTPPEIFVRNHYPQDSRDSLLNEIIGKEDFLNRPLVYEAGLTDYRLNKPTSGTLERKETHSFEIESEVPISRIRMYYNGGWLDVGELTVSNNKYSFQVSLPNKVDHELLIYIDSEAIFGFKVKS
ncbi:hypothetical protein J1N09_11690 [Aureitalea sp. L0-47]|uniref:transglutaminase domain-containing protein n=1 Tax=Aureitalea sp. L0-47 TaxID=2816962 RepID=UPI0022377D7C|nr:transglutaminase domain-containing protein [Aureitalea sp. L0-47]MCW5520507.1 hypothetical protein [Aureitalea sp. L0-47]